MNAIITQYKKIALLAVAAIAMNGNITVLAARSSCAVAAVDAAQTTLDATRAPYEQLFNPYTGCESGDCIPNTCDLNSKLQTLFNCCVSTNQQVRCQGHEFEKCCKKLRHKIDNVEDQTVVIETLIGDPATTVASLQDCSVDVLNYVNTNNDDVLTWLKKLYVLMYQVFSCTCCVG